MDDKMKSPVDIMAHAMTEIMWRAIDAERQRDAAREDAQNWYRLYLDKDKQLKEKEEKLTALREYVEALEDKKRKAVKEAEQRRKNSAGEHKYTTEAKTAAETPQTSADEQGGQANA